MKLSPKYLLSALLLLLILSACTPPAGSARGFSYIWYVALTGDNANTCDAPASPCRTLEGALVKARATNTRVEAEYAGETLTLLHTVNVMAGTYNETGLHEGYPFARADINVSIVGAGQATTIFDAAGTYGGVYINGDIRVTLRDLTIQNVDGSAPDSCVNIRGDAEVTMENVTVRRCVKSGVAHQSTGTLTAINVTATENIVDVGGNGVGISSFGTLIVEGGNFSANEGNGIRSNGTAQITAALFEDNGRDGLILNSNATVADVTIQNNGRDGSFRAGLAINSSGTVRVDNAQILSNQFGVEVHGGVLYLTNSTVNGNPRTGVLVSGGELRLTDTVIENSASFYAGTSLAGGLGVETGARAVVRTSDITGNLNGGINNYGELFLIESSITGNDGGMPALFNAAGAVAVLERSLIAGNTLSSGAVTGDTAVDNRGSMNTVNLTISGNDGSGITNSGALNLAFASVAFNEDYGLLSSASGSEATWVASSIIAGNGIDCYDGGFSGPGPYTLSGPSIDSDGSCGFPQTAALADLYLDPLADNGGPTLTHALLDGSPAINASTGSCPPNDQRLIVRPFGPACDVGAYESSSATAFSLDTELPTHTPGALTLIVIPDQNYNCREGNSTSFDIADTLLKGQEYSPLGIGGDQLWLQFAGPTYGELCWAPTSGFTLLLNGEQVQLAQLPKELLSTVAYPLAPTATPDPDEGDGDQGETDGQSGIDGQDGAGGPTTPAAPGGLAAKEVACSANGYEVMLTWNDNSDNESGFRIYHNGKVVATVGPNVTKYAHTVPGNWGQQQIYYVEAFNDAGAAKSNTASEDGCLY